ncbi:MAG: hypothetical protein JXQ80_08975, partial [Bacteroidales bacterium]|nr:hypothetical protein [Bacteroidales bacterium]
PSFRLSPYWENNILFNTDKSRRVMFGLQQQSQVSTDGVSRNYLVEPSLTFRLGNHFFVKSELGYTHNTDDFMYVSQVMAEGTAQYILARIKQQTYDFTFRINYNITPDLSVQYYGSPFVSSGSYSRFKKALEPGSRTPGERTYTFTETEIAYDAGTDSYAVSDQGLTYSFDNPDFSFREFRSNLVVRWEYRPGSTLYLVWENNRNNHEPAYTSSLGQQYDALFSTAPTNVFMIKLNFWLGI